MKCLLKDESSKIVVGYITIADLAMKRVMTWVIHVTMTVRVIVLLWLCLVGFSNYRGVWLRHRNASTRCFMFCYWLFAVRTSSFVNVASVRYQAKTNVMLCHVIAWQRDQAVSQTSLLMFECLITTVVILFSQHVITCGGKHLRQCYSPNY